MTTKKQSVLAEADALINGQRRKDYGPAEESFNHIAAGWSLILGADISGTDVALCMAWLKISRFLQGGDRDSIVDLAGYAGLIEVIGFGDAKKEGGS